MKRLSALEYLKLNKFQAFLYNLKLFFCAIPLWFCKLGRGILRFFKNCGLAIAGEFKDIGYTFAKGNWAVKLSFFIFGFGNFFYGQFLRGMLFLLFEIVFVFFMFVPIGGNPWVPASTGWTRATGFRSATPWVRSRAASSTIPSTIPTYGSPVTIRSRSCSTAF